MREIVYDNYYWQNDLIRLRAWSADDWNWDYCTNFDSETLRLADCELSLPPTVVASQKFSERIKDFSTANNRTYFAIETLDGTLVGRINILLGDEQHGTFEVATKIDKEYRGKGYGTAAMRIMLKYAFMEKRLNKYCASILEGNLESIAMHEKLGCEQEGVCKQNIYTNGRYHDEILFGLTKEDYLKKINSCRK
ncbi:GNAT family N-acetyltransferase [Tissierella carlieri]|uniref:GNAT family N-acetyltransferase n=1 Tax=Tissierella carlieri TaxID=689904 RepID=A0ABT1SDS2_9FIRM|nr:GNAT family protein [Tissierella carlieri]MBU5311348.1 GNAT family N-acetyltransferase [Tissierella carlieri]MCQ4924642.1 GNAT family N-acetyltransferase [Tissierella carlieri]